MAGGVRDKIDRVVARAGREVRGKVLRDLGDDVMLARSMDDHTFLFPKDDYIGREILATGGYQRHTLDNAIALLSLHGALADGRSFLDVGANIGTHSIYAALTGRFSDLICVEPDPGNLHVLHLNLRVNGLDDQVSVLPCAMGAETGSAEMVRNARNSGNASLAIGRMKVKHPTDPYRVPVRRLDDMLAETDAGPVGLIWMDVEGFELNVMRGAGVLLATRPPIVFEYSVPAHDAEDRAEMAQTVFSHWTQVFIERGTWQPIDRSAFEALDGPCDILAFA